MLTFLPAITRAKVIALSSCPKELEKFLQNIQLTEQLRIQTMSALSETPLLERKNCHCCEQIKPSLPLKGSIS